MFTCSMHGNSVCFYIKTRLESEPVTADLTTLLSYIVINDANKCSNTFNNTTHKHLLIYDLVWWVSDLHIFKLKHSADNFHIYT